MSGYKYPKLTLIGAGPGDPELITLKGINALKTADVVLYDALVNPALLDYAPPAAVKIYVGKRNHSHTYSQEQINNLIVDYAFTHGHVVRLKGGDPFVFGRGSEEMAFAENFNIATTIVPGISSSIGVPGLSGIPVTHRGVSESFWVITGTTQNNRLAEDLSLAARSKATIVILMGLNKLQEIVAIFRKENKAHLPVAIIQDGSLKTQKEVLGTIDTILTLAAEKNIQAPAIIMIGEVVKRHKAFEPAVEALNILFN